MDNHYIKIDNRERTVVSQVEDVDAFDEGMLWANLKEGGLEISGENLHIEKLDLQEGMLILSGRIETLTYTDRKKQPKKMKFPFRTGNR